jgi:hypothetical protein
MSRLSLKAFSEAVERQLAACSADELRAILRAMAQGTSPIEREAVLERLREREETVATVQ